MPDEPGGGTAHTSNPQPSDRDWKRNVEAAAERILEAASADFDRAGIDIDQQLKVFRALIESAIHLNEAFPHRDRSWYGTMTTIANVISDTATQLAKDLAIEGVIEHQLSRRAAGEILSVHENTVARWVKQHTQATTSGPETIMDVLGTHEELPTKQQHSGPGLDSDRP